MDKAFKITVYCNFIICVNVLLVPVAFTPGLV